MSRDPIVRKFAIFATLSAATAAGVLGALAYRVTGRILAEGLRQEAQGTADVLAQSVANELQSLAARSRFYASSNQKQAFERDGAVLALTVLDQPRQAPSAYDSDEWNPASRWLLPQNHPSRLGESDLRELDLKHPVDFARIGHGQLDAVFGSSKGSLALLRIGIPFGEKSADGTYARALVADAAFAPLQAIFGHRPGLTAFLASGSGHLIVASAPGRFIQKEDLSGLPVVTAAKTSPEARGTRDYSETPGGELQYAAFHRVPAAPGLVVVAQAPASRVQEALEPLLAAMAAAGAAFALLFGAVLGVFGGRSIGRRVRYLEEAIQDAQSPSAFAKIHDPGARQALEAGQVKLSGERIEAPVLHAHLHGMERVTAHADPEKLLQCLNAFNQQAVQGIEARHGIVDHIHGGSIVAFWGVPEPLADGVAQAIAAANDIRQAVLGLNHALEELGQPAVTLGMGLHYGPVAVGQVGASGRLEYSALGEAVEIAGRIQQFAGQFGTDFVLTGAAASRAGSSIATDRLTAGDEETPELFELGTGEEEAGAEVESEAGAAAKSGAANSDAVGTEAAAVEGTTPEATAAEAVLDEAEPADQAAA